MFFKRFNSGMYAANCYLLAENGKAVVIDCGVDIDEFMEAVRENHLTVELIVLTHAHIDYMTEVDIMRERRAPKPRYTNMTSGASSMSITTAPSITEAAGPSILRTSF